MTCEARQVGDQMLCACGLAWDVADKERPQCRRGRHPVPGHVPPEVRQAIEVDRRTGPADRRSRRPSVMIEAPLELPADVALEMARAAFAQVGVRVSPAEELRAMRAAHRVMLDRLA